MHPTLRHLAPLLLLALLALPGPGGDARAAGMNAPPGIRPKDFAFVKKDGVYHLFYIRHSDYLPLWATENDFGHAVSTDLYNWTQLPPVMAIDPYGWDNLHVWAPHIVEADGLWWMVYTGVSDAPGRYFETQRLGLAVSSDLMTWTRVHTGPMWGNYAAPWAWWAPLRPGMACRDPFLMRDPAAPEQWLLYYTASPADDTLATVVGVARSATGQLDAWEDEKPLWITHRSLTFNPITESPHLFEHDGRWLLFITTSSGQPLTFYESANPLGDPAEWTYRGRLRNMLGWDTSSWAASEVLRDGEHDLFAFTDITRIEIRRIVWQGPSTFTLDQPSAFHMVGMSWTRPTARENQFVGLRLASANGYAMDRSLVAWVRDAAGGETAAPLDSLGLPARPGLGADTVVVPWFARRWPGSLGPDEAMVVRVAMDDGTASTPWLRVVPNPVRRLDGGWPSGTESDTAHMQPEPPTFTPLPEDSLPEPLARAPDPAGATGGASLRVLEGTPLGGGPAIAIALVEAGEVRVEVYDLQGRRVARLAERRLAAGTHVLSWDGRDANGAPARRGLYFVRAVTPAGVATARLLLRP